MASYTLIRTEADVDSFSEAVAGASVVAIDCEGCDLSRVGTIELLSLAVTRDQVFLFDFQVKDPVLKERQLAVVKRVLENEDVTKVVHDCRQDCDALHKLYDVTVTNIFDTQLAHQEILGATVRKGLNDVLRYYGCSINTERELFPIDYKKTPNFWAKRPLTEQMLKYAAGDVAELLTLYKNQMNKLDLRTPIVNEKSNAAATEFISMKKHKVVQVPTSLIGKVIGTGGKNIDAMAAKSKCQIHKVTGGFLVVGHLDSDITLAEKLIIAEMNRPRNSYW